MHKNRFAYLIYVIVALAVALLFLLVFPYHLFHREQINLFLLNTDYIARYFDGYAWLPTMTGEYFTQYYYYIGAGPAIIAVVLLGIGFVSHKLLSRLISVKWIVVAISTLLMCYECWREMCGIYPLASSLSMLMGLSLALCYPRNANIIVRNVVAVLLVAFAAWAIGYGSWIVLGYIVICELLRKEFRIAALLLCFMMPYSGFKYGGWFTLPNLVLEKQFEADTRAFRGENNFDVDESILNTPIGDYYEFMTKVSDFNAKELYWDTHDYRQIILMPVDNTGNYCTITAAGEIWYRLGDMTMAEHATMLGMIFSPSHHGTRHLKRLAEINIINGDEAAARKYLHMLSQTSVHKKWADAHKVGCRSDVYQKSVDLMRRYTIKSDTLRMPMDYPRSLRALLENNIRNQNAPFNHSACSYLLALDMQNKDIAGFADDYIRYAYGVHNRSYDEALLVAMTLAPPSVREHLMNLDISPEVVKDFGEFNRLYSAKDSKKLQERFSKSYWFYCQFLKTRK